MAELKANGPVVGRGRKRSDGGDGDVGGTVWFQEARHPNINW